jgi:hypothetical protein
VVAAGSLQQHHHHHHQQQQHQLQSGERALMEDAAREPILAVAIADTRASASAAASAVLFTCGSAQSSPSPSPSPGASSLPPAFSHLHHRPVMHRVASFPDESSMLAAVRSPHPHPSSLKFKTPSLLQLKTPYFISTTQNHVAFCRLFTTSSLLTPTSSSRTSSHVPSV